MPRIIHTIKLEIKGGAASPGAQLASLSAKGGMKPIDFCKDFNEKTKDRQGKLLRAQLKQLENKSWITKIKNTPTPQLLMEIAKLKKGSSEPNRDKVASLTKDQIKQIAEAKQADTNAFQIESTMKMIEGTARSMGITIN